MAVCAICTLVDPIAHIPLRRGSMLVFVKASKGDIEGALDRSSICIDFLERYPGFSSW